MDTIGRRLRYLRGIKGITQDMLAEAITENRASIANWENDRMAGFLAGKRCASPVRVGAEYHQKG